MSDHTFTSSTDITQNEIFNDVIQINLLTDLIEVKT